VVTAARAMIGSMTRTSILVVQQQPELRRALQAGLRAKSYDVMAAGTGREAMALAATQPPDAVIFDLSLPDADGLQVIGQLRDRYRAPIIVLSARSSPGDKIGALDAGADDYVTKPFVMGELLARLRAKLRRREGGAVPGQPAPAVIGRWQVDLASHRIARQDPAPESGDPGDPGDPGASRKPGQTPRLTPVEWAVLEPLLRRPGQLVDTAQLVSEVWGGGRFQPGANSLRFHLVQLRRKLEDDPGRPRHLLTERGLGHRYLP
jgi:two-component system, OmpR family, KDP operon response regulator KdpE